MKGDSGFQNNSSSCFGWAHVMSHPLKLAFDNTGLNQTTEDKRLYRPRFSESGEHDSNAHYMLNSMWENKLVPSRKSPQTNSDACKTKWECRVRYHAVL